jgi:hypothetical protein
MGWLNTPITLATLVLPSLLLVIGGSYAVHMTAVVLEREEKDGHLSVEAVLQQVGLPIIVSSVTTAIGFGSLAFHPIPASPLSDCSPRSVSRSPPSVLIGPLTFAACPRGRARFVPPSAPRMPRARSSIAWCLRRLRHRPLGLCGVGCRGGHRQPAPSASGWIPTCSVSGELDARGGRSRKNSGASPISIVITGPT